MMSLKEVREDETVVGIRFEAISLSINLLAYP